MWLLTVAGLGVMKFDSISVGIGLKQRARRRGGSRFESSALSTPSAASAPGAVKGALLISSTSSVVLESERDLYPPLTRPAVAIYR